MGLGVRPQRHAVTLGQDLHGPQVVFKSVQIQDQAGRIDGFNWIARAGRRRMAIVLACGGSASRTACCTSSMDTPKSSI